MENTNTQGTSRFQDIDKATGLVNGIFIPDEEDMVDGSQEASQDASQEASQETTGQDEGAAASATPPQEEVKAEVTEEVKAEATEESKAEVTEEVKVVKESGDEVIDEIMSLIEGVDKEADAVEKKLEESSDDAEKKQLLRELRIKMQEKEVLLEELAAKNEILLKRLNSEQEKRFNTEVTSNEYKSVYDKVSGDKSIQRLVELASTRNQDESSRRSFADALADLYKSTTGEDLQRMADETRRNEKSAMSQSFGSDIPSGGNIAENGLKDGIFIPD